MNMQPVLAMLNYALLLLFGILASIQFAGVEKRYSRPATTVLLLLFFLVVQVLSWYFWGLDATFKLYPFIVHLPLILFLIFFCKRPPLRSLVSVLTAYLCCQFANWFGTLALYLSGSQIAYYAVDIALLIPLYLLLRRWAAPALCQLMNLSQKSLLLFGIVPAAYYIFDYAVTVYTEALYSGAQMVVEFMPSMVCLCYVAFAVLYYGELRRRGDSEQERQLLSIQLKAARQHMDELKGAQEQARCYRHDIRHHLTLIGGYLAVGDTDQLRRYLLEVQQDIDAITPVRYCANETVNLILSSFAAEAKKQGVNLCVDATLPETISLGDTELCALLSNAVENALSATRAVTDGREKTVRVECRMRDDKLLLLVENPYMGQVDMVDGAPQSHRAGHGFGVRNIVSITEKHNGLYSFTAEAGLFTLRLVL
ncbi:MAG: GHKL domain-containing protein [Oscillibacter sp.]